MPQLVGVRAIYVLPTPLKVFEMGPPYYQCYTGGILYTPLPSLRISLSPLDIARCLSFSF
jgi:hypothetical protein